MKSVVPVAVIVGWLAIALYFGSGGITRMENNNLIKKTIDEKDTAKVEYNGILFKNRVSMQSILEGEKTQKLFPWAEDVPSYLSYIITACSFGMIGALIAIILQIASKKARIEDTPYWSLPVLGALTGLVVLGLSLLIPNLFFSGELDVKPGALMFICLFSGIYSDKFYENLYLIFSGLLNKKKE
ncbi:hypothetical protein [Pinibacter soli]|uniref:Uncharacterized protein n=1 Tax=Pinibacter soli TaxID=3044211 RepID=A0ABT6RDE4_9BACT|nr:hypothetical protein [Pinibacter soli]MDI3320421.1 hypothetical protein [Pinibacter soli]